jgi:hypothetical protein
VSQSSRPTRRRFTRTLTLGAAVSLLLVQGAAAEDDPQAAAAQALAEIVRRRHGKDLSKEQLEHIARSILHDRRTAERLRKVPLANGDEPAVAFTADLP